MPRTIPTDAIDDGTGQSPAQKPSALRSRRNMSSADGFDADRAGQHTSRALAIPVARHCLTSTTQAEATGSPWSEDASRLHGGLACAAD